MNINYYQLIIKEIKRLDKNKASQKSNIPITIIYENADIFVNFFN